MLIKHRRATAVLLQSSFLQSGDLRQLCDAGLGSPRLLGCGAAELGDEPCHPRWHSPACISQLTTQRDDYKRYLLVFQRT